MKLAEALQERADINRRIEELNSRIRNNCLTQEGEQPSEDAGALISELDGCVERLEYLMAAINRTNNIAEAEGRTLTQLIAERDALTVKLTAYRSFVIEASQKTSRARFSEIKILSTVDVPKLQKQVDAMSKRLRIVDNTLQAANWSVELMD